MVKESSNSYKASMKDTEAFHLKPTYKNNRSSNKK